MRTEVGVKNLVSKRANRIIAALTGIHLAGVSLLGISLAAGGFASIAHAEPLKPAGLYSEAKVDPTEKNQTKKVDNDHAPSPPPPVSSAPTAQKPEPGSLATDVKRWARGKLNSFKSFASSWFGQPQPSTAQPPAKDPSNRSIASEPPKPAAAAAPSDVYVPPPPVGQNLAAPAPPASSSDQQEQRDLSGLKRSSSGVPIYDLKAAEAIPVLKIELEEKFSPSRFALDTRNRKVLVEKIIHQLESPDPLTEARFKALSRIGTPGPTKTIVTKDPVFTPKGKVNREAFDRIIPKLRPEPEIKLAKFKPLTAQEMRFLNGLLLFQQGDKCSVAVGLFHKLSKEKGWQSEADYYLAMCSRKLGLETDFLERARRILESQDIHYSKKILKEIGPDVPYDFTESFGAALLKASGNAKIMDGLDPKIRGNVAYILAEYNASTEHFKTSLAWAKQVPEDNPKYLQAQFLVALGEYQTGSKATALKIQEQLIGDMGANKQKVEFRALIALNAARMYFQERDFKSARETFLKVYKDHPMWLQSLTEMGWAQLMGGDYEGAIGNMYSIQSPFFGNVYKPESYVIRTIGYINLCQYGDAYRTLSILERDYRPSLNWMDAFIKGAGNRLGYYQTVRDFIASQAQKSPPKEINGLPAPVIREMARHRDFTNLQKALNRQSDERQAYGRLDADVDKSLKRAQWLVNNSRRRSETLRKQIAGIKQNPQMEQNRLQWMAELNRELGALNDHFFQIDLYNEAKAALPEYRKDVVGGADARMAKMREKIERVLANRLLRMKTDLARMLDNNELLRYEVFSGSGENIRYQVAGGEQSNRIPASVIPKSKSLQWDFDGEYWEDEIGHYRSSLKNNCPDPTHHETAHLDGGT